MISSKIMKKFMVEAVKQLNGDWIIVGGSLLPLLDIESRVTVDIDIAPLNRTDQQLEILKIAEKLKLPIEVINTAAGFYIHQLKNVEGNILLINESKHCRIFRPNLYLYLQLKLKRGTESDIEDCMNYTRYCAVIDNINWTEIQRHVNKIKTSKRLEPLIKLIKKYTN